MTPNSHPHGTFTGLFHNGGRTLLAAYSAFILSAVALGVVYFTQPVDTPGLCEYPSPMSVLTHANGESEPSVNANGIIVVRIVRCVIGSKPLNVLTYRTFRSTDGGETVSDLSGEPQARLPGISSTDVPIQLSPKLTPGKHYHIDGIEQVPSTGELRTWFSDTFQVLN